MLGGHAIPTRSTIPATSLSVGQRYIAQLLDRLDGNLLELGGAYNAGPRAVNRWLTTKAGKDDPLLFVESIPVAETRSYVKRLMDYHWLYRRRFGQDAAQPGRDRARRNGRSIARPVATAAAATGQFSRTRCRQPSRCQHRL